MIILLIPLILVLAQAGYKGYKWFRQENPKPQQIEEQQQAGHHANREEQNSEEQIAAQPSIALLAPLSGTFIEDGEMLRNGAQLAWEEIKKQGVTAELVILDGAKDPSEIIDTVGKMAQDPDTLLLIGHLPMASLSAIMPICGSQKLPLLAPASSHQGLVNQPWVFPLVGSDVSEGSFAAGLAQRWSEGKPVAAVYEPGPYGEILQGGFKEEAGKRNLEFYNIECRADEASLETAVAAVLENDPSVVWLAGAPVWGAGVATALAEKGFKGRLIAPQSYGDIFLEDLFGKVLDRLYILTSFSVPDDRKTALEEFSKAFRERFWREPDRLAVAGYDAVQWVGKALQEASLSRKSVRDYFLRHDSPQHLFRGIGGDVFFDANGCTQRSLQLAVYRQGKLCAVPEL
jgi:branched-chain amino acid transport system substrate-binding protein